MRPTILLLTVLLLGSSPTAFCQEKKSATPAAQDWDAAYEELLKKDSGVREKIKNGDATKEDVIAWLKENSKTSGKKAATKKAGTGKEKDSQPNGELVALRKKLAEFVRSGKLTKPQAMELWQTMAGPGKTKEKSVDWDAAYEDLLRKDAGLRAKIDSGMATKEDVIAWMKSQQKAGGQSKKKGKGKQGARPGSVNFYAIVIGRLRSKDIELGEMELDIDYVISDRTQLNSQLIGKRIKLVGIAGQFLDSLLQIKRGETLKVRTGDFNPETKQLGFGDKFQVLERTPPFKPENFGVPPKEFRGFSGELIGKVVEAAGYEVLLEVSEIKPSGQNKATDAASIKGKRIRIAGFYRDHADAFGDLNTGDRIRVSTQHRNPQSDSVDVTDVLEKVR
jgi:hypothetical protein